jgi:hypothetical protein
MRPHKEGRMEISIGPDFGDARQRAINTGALGESIAHTTNELQELKRLVAFLLAKLTAGETVKLTDEAVLRFYGLPTDASEAEAGRRAKSFLEPLGLLECGRCKAKAKDVPGVTDEKCPFCGEPIGSVE